MRRCVVVLAALVLGAGLAGCSRLLGQRYDNFTSYYNTFYNARSEFEREEEQLLQAEPPVDRDRFLTLFFEPGEGGAQREGFEKAIEKGADLLRDHPESKWVDDALLLIGKARFYQGDWAGAEEKFREVIELGTDKLVDEAWFWLGRTLLSAERYEDAALALREGLDRPEVRERWAARMRLVLAETDVREGDWEEAVTSLRDGIAGVDDRELAARAEFLLGQVYEATDQSAEATEAFGRAARLGPRYELAYAAGLSQALALSTAGEAEPALDLLGRMGRDDKNFDRRVEIGLARARVLSADERPAEARDLLLGLLYDPDPSMQPGTMRGPIHYRLAEVYRDGLNSYVQAAAHYDTAATAIRQVDLRAERTTAQAITDAPVLGAAFGSYARVAGQIADMDSLLHLGGLDSLAFEAAIEEIRDQRRREREAEQRDLDRRRTEQGFGGAPGVGGLDDRPGETDAGLGATPPGGDAGFLGFRNPAQIQDELVRFRTKWGDRAYVPNWRRAEALAAIEVQEQTAESLEGTNGVQTPDRTRDDFVDTSQVPRNLFSQQRMRASRAAARYELGNTLFLALGRPDSAASFYRSVIDEDPESAVAQRAAFALAETQRALGNMPEAERLYNEVIERYPDSRFADQSRAQLGLAPAERAAADSLELAEAAYQTAYARWQAGDHEAALDQMLTLAHSYSTTPVAARARLAAGAVYTEWAAGDEAALLAPTPTLAPALADSLLLLSANATGAPPADPLAADSVATTPVTNDQPPADSTQVPPDRPDELDLPELDVPGELAGDDLPADLDEPLGDLDPVGDLAADSTEAALLPEFGDLAEVRPPADSALAAEDSTLLAPDDSQPNDALPNEAGSEETVPEETVPEEAVPEENPWLDVLYASIEADFPDTPYAERARTLRTVLDALRPDRTPAADSTGADSTGVDATGADALVGEQGTGEQGAGAEEALRGEAPIVHQKSTFAWLVFSSLDRAEAEGVLADVAAQGYRAALNTFTDRARREDNVFYQVLVGSFGSEAEAARAGLPERLVGGALDPEAFSIFRLGPGRGEIEQAAELFPDTDPSQGGDQ